MATCLLLLAGCRAAKHAAAPPTPAAPPPPPRISEIDLKSYHPNEAGAVMILMYHRIEATTSKSDMYRSPDQFRADLETLYARGYRPVTLAEFAENRMDVPAGKTPVVITFDDSYPSQFCFAGPGSRQISPDCGVGIIEDMHRRHADWATRATFFVLAHSAKYPPPFGADSVADKFAYLTQHGYEVASHTATHRFMRGMQADEVQKELATAVRDIQAYAPGLKVTSLALPYGVPPRSPEARKAVLSGSADGTAYEHSAVALAAWRAVMGPTTKSDAKAAADQLVPFNPTRLERIVPDANRPSTPGTFEFYIKFFDTRPDLRYVSDGNPKVVAVPKTMEGLIDTARMQAQGKTVQTYSQEIAPIAPITPPAPR